MNRTKLRVLVSVCAMLGAVATFANHDRDRCSGGYCEGDEVYDLHGMGRGEIVTVTMNPYNQYVVDFGRTQEFRMSYQISRHYRSEERSNINCLRSRQDICIGDWVDDEQSSYSGSVVDITPTRLLKVDFEGGVHLRDVNDVRLRSRR